MPAALDLDATAAAPRRPLRRALFVLLGFLVLAALGYALSPVVGAVRLAQAAVAGDVAGIESRVAFNRLRRSIARQLAAAAVGQRQLQGPERQLALTAGTAAAHVWLDQLLTARTIADLLSGRPLGPGAAARGAGPIDLSPMRALPLGTAFDIWRRSRFTGLASYEFVLQRADGGEVMRLGLELHGLTWRLSSLTLPQDLRDEMGRRAAAAVARAPQP